MAKPDPKHPHSDKPIQPEGGDDRDLISEVLQKSRAIRQEAPHKRLRESGLNAQDEWERVKTPSGRMLVAHREHLDAIRFTERDGQGRVRNIQSLLDESLDFLFLSRRLAEIATQQGTTPFKMVEEWVEAQVKKAAAKQR